MEGSVAQPLSVAQVEHIKTQCQRELCLLGFEIGKHVGEKMGKLYPFIKYVSHQPGGAILYELQSGRVFRVDEPREKSDFINNSISDVIQHSVDPDYRALIAETCDFTSPNWGLALDQLRTISERCETLLDAHRK